MARNNRPWHGALILALVALSCGGCRKVSSRTETARSDPAPVVAATQTEPAPAEVVAFTSGSLTLRGVIYKPQGPGPFPAVLYNHGSAAGMLSQAAFEALGPLFAARGWVFFAPWRRGQGLSESAGPYIQDEIRKASNSGGMPAGAETMVRLLQTDHLDDQVAAHTWLRYTTFVEPNRIAVAGNSFGGIQTVLGAARVAYCAAVDLSGGAQSWKDAPGLQTAMMRAVRNTSVPILFIQAENDYDLSPTKVLSAAMKDSGKRYEVKIYPPFGSSPAEGHAFAYQGASIWFDDAFGFLQRHCGK